MSKRRVVSKSCSSSSAIDTSLRGQAEDRLADGAQRLREGLDTVRPRHEARLEMHLRHAHVVAREKTAERLGHEAAHCRHRAGP